MTFSIAARCSETGMFGTVVTSSSICVASRCAFVRAGVGAAQTQNITDPDLGPLLLNLCAGGLDAQAAVDRVVDTTENIQWRQLSAIDRNGSTASFSGSQTLGIHGHADGSNCVAIGNMLANSEVPQAMVDAFEQSDGGLPGRLLLALEAGLVAGGEAGPIHSAGILVVADASWPVVNLRVDWDVQPDNAIKQLRFLWDNYAPQMQAYIIRAKNPASSESYGVPGDE